MYMKMEAGSLNTLPVGEVIIFGSTYMSKNGLFSGPKRKKSMGKKMGFFGKRYQGCGISWQCKNQVQSTLILLSVFYLCGGGVTGALGEYSRILGKRKILTWW